MNLLLLSLLRMFHLGSASVSHRVLIYDITQNLASRGGVPFALFPIGCHHSSYSDAPASLINYDVLYVSRYPPRVIVVICEADGGPATRWSQHYRTYVRLYGPHHFTLIDFTIREIFKFRYGEVVAVPFSCVLYRDDGDYFEIHVDSDFSGERPSWTPIVVSRQDVADNQVDLSKLLFFNSSVHNSPMRIQVDQNLIMQIYPAYVTNYSKPGQAVYAGNGIVDGYTPGHFPSNIPILLEEEVAIYLSPKVLSNDLMLLFPFSPLIWMLIGIFSAVIALMMTLSIRDGSRKNIFLIFVENLIYAFSHMFTTLKLPQPSKFKFVTTAFASVLWTVLCIIPQTGYKGSLASLLQKPPTEEKIESTKLARGWSKQTVRYMEPDFVHFMHVLRSGEPWFDASTSANFLRSIWGLTKATYTARIVPLRLQTTSLQCLSRQGIVFACRSLQLKMRQLFETDFAYTYMSRLNRDIAVKTHDP